jgi:hypothetical protein
VTQLGIVTTTSETAFARSPETIYDFVTNPANWTKTYPGSGDRVFTRHLAIAMRPRLWMFNSVGALGHDRDGKGGMNGRITAAVGPELDALDGGKHAGDR